MATAEIEVVTPLHASSSSWMTITRRATKHRYFRGRFSAKSGIQAKKWEYFVNRGASQYSS